MSIDDDFDDSSQWVNDILGDANSNTAEQSKSRSWLTIMMVIIVVIIVIVVYLYLPVSSGTKVRNPLSQMNDKEFMDHAAYETSFDYATTQYS